MAEVIVKVAISDYLNKEELKPGGVLQSTGETIAEYVSRPPEVRYVSVIPRESGPPGHASNHP